MHVRWAVLCLLFCYFDWVCRLNSSLDSGSCSNTSRASMSTGWWQCLPQNLIQAWAEKRNSCPSPHLGSSKTDRVERLWTRDSDSALLHRPVWLSSMLKHMYVGHFIKLPLMIWSSSSDGPASHSLPLLGWLTECSAHVFKAWCNYGLRTTFYWKLQQINNTVCIVSS